MNPSWDAAELEDYLIRGAVHAVEVTLTTHDAARRFRLALYNHRRRHYPCAVVIRLKENKVRISPRVDEVVSARELDNGDLE